MTVTSFQPEIPTDGPFWLKRFADSIVRLFKQILPVPLRLARYTTALLPPAADYEGGIVYDTTADCLKISDGTNWVVATDADLAAIAALTGTGLLARTGTGTWATRTLTAPAAGFTITNPAGIAGNPTFVLSDDLLAVEESGIATAGVAYTPTITAGTGTFTSVSAAGRWKQVGKSVFVRITITITTNGTAATYIDATLPVASANVGANNFQVITGMETAVVFSTIRGAILNNSTTCRIQRYDAVYIGANGYILNLTGFYEAA